MGIKVFAGLCIQVCLDPASIPSHQSIDDSHLDRVPIDDGSGLRLLLLEP